MNGMLQGNGPFLWQPGTPRPVRNPYSWANLTNIVYIDQPAGTGFSPGPGAIKDVTDIAHQFISWFKNFVEIFGLQGRKVYIAGESYAGHMIPYIASRMLDEEDATYLNVKGIQIIDSVINKYSVLQQGKASSIVHYFPLPRNYHLRNQAFKTNAEYRSSSRGCPEPLSGRIRSK